MEEHNIKICWGLIIRFIQTTQTPSPQESVELIKAAISNDQLMINKQNVSMQQFIRI